MANGNKDRKTQRKRINTKKLRKIIIKKSENDDGNNDDDLEFRKNHPIFS